MPYFTVAQGLQGLEGGLRTGMPEFSAGEAQVRLEGINWFSTFDGDSCQQVKNHQKYQPYEIDN